MKRRIWFRLAGVILTGFASAVFAARINQEGRILGAAPVVTNAVLFNTNQADAILSAMQIFPATNPWNEDISNRPLLPNSDAMIENIATNLSSSRRSLRVFQEMNFVLAPDSQPLMPIAFLVYPGDSDPGPYPIPSNMPIETWPTGTGGLTLYQWQQDINNTGGDRHSIVVQPGTGDIWETWQAKLVGTNWQASNGAKFNLYTNGLRTPYLTSGDAAGLCMFPALVRFDECQRGMVEHACRIVVAKSRHEFIYPATHYASSLTSTNVPAMGQRVRLKSSFAIPAGWSAQEQALLAGLKKYGALVADNGNFFSISITPDDRWPATAWDHISTIGITNFEVVQTTGPNEGPRSAGAPVAIAGADFTVNAGAITMLQGFVTTSSPPSVIRCKLYSGPTNLVFGNTSLTNTSVTFNAPGVYTLMLSASNGVHAVAYDAVVVTALPVINLSSSLVGTSLSLNWNGGQSPYVVERTFNVSLPAWSGILTTATTSATLPVTATNCFFRVRGS